MFERFLVKITGKPQWPGSRYVYDRLVKYLFFVPPTLLRAKIRELKNYIPEENGKKFLFIGGLHRSGTSALYKVFKSHPEIGGMSNTTVPEDEGQHLQSVFKPDSTYGMLFSHNEESHLTENSEIANSNNRKKLLKEWGRFLDFSKPVLIEKSPSNIVRTRLLQYFFSQSTFVVVMRHPIAVALAVKKWTREPLYEIIEHWVVSHKIYLSDMEHLNSAMLIRYEDFSLKQEDILTKIYCAVGLRRTTSKVKFIDMNESYFLEWTRNKYLEQPDMRKLHTKYNNLFSSFGYSLSPPYVLPLEK